MRNIIVFCIVSLLCSCNNNKVEKTLISMDKKWKMKSIKDGKILFSGGFFSFNDDDTYKYTFSFDEFNVGTEELNLHKTDDRKWILKGGDSIFLGNRNDKNYSYKIIRYNSDTLWLKNNENTFLLIKVDTE